MSVVPTAQSQQHLDSKVSKFLGFHRRGVEIYCIVAFSGELVSGSNGSNEP